jgi:hypothetical protein
MDPTLFLILPEHVSKAHHVWKNALILAQLNSHHFNGNTFTNTGNDPDTSSKSKNENNSFINEKPEYTKAMMKIKKRNKASLFNLNMLNSKPNDFLDLITTPWLKTNMEQIYPNAYPAPCSAQANKDGNYEYYDACSRLVGAFIYFRIFNISINIIFIFTLKYYSYYSIFLLRLHDEIILFTEYIMPSREEYLIRNDLIGRITQIIKNEWPESSVDIFGSFKTKLYLPTR